MRFTQGQLVVIDEHTLGVLVDEGKSVQVLRSSITKRAPCAGPVRHLIPAPRGTKKMRSATERDLEEFGVCANGYKKDGYLQ